MALKLNLNYVGKYADKEKFDSMRSEVSAAHKMLTEGTGLGSDFLGWLDLPVNFDKDEFRRIKESAEKIKKDSEVLVVLGIGGSYLGARAVIEFIKSNNYNLLKRTRPISILAATPSARAPLRSLCSSSTAEISR